MNGTKKMNDITEKVYAVYTYDNPSHYLMTLCGDCVKQLFPGGELWLSRRVESEDPHTVCGMCEKKISAVTFKEAFAFGIR